MDFLNEKVTSIYSKYLLAAFGSAMITSIYSIVDMAMVGHNIRDRRELRRWLLLHRCGTLYTVWDCLWE